MNAPVHINLGNIGDLAQPINKLIDVIAKGTGLAPLGTLLQAKADAKAKIIETKAQISVNSITDRAQVRAKYREELRQQNIEKVSMLAIQELPESVSSTPVEQDWVLQFFDCAQDVCDEEMQMLWSRILTGEVVSPGSYSKQTLQFLKTLEKIDAHKFSELCAFAFTDDDGWHYIAQDKLTQKEMRDKLGNGDIVGHFKSIGLIFPEAYMPRASSLDGTAFNYFGSKYKFEGSNKSKNNPTLIEPFFPFLALSRIGQQLAKVARPQAIGGYVQRLSEALTVELNVSLASKPSENIKSAL